MADQALTPTVLAADTVSAAIASTSLTSSNDGVITPKTDRTVLIFTDATGGGTVTIKAVTAAQQASYPGAGGTLMSQGDITITLGSTEVKAIVIQSARVKALKTTDTTTRGTIRVSVTANTGLRAFCL
jgi:hypothetical protein